MLAQFVRSFDTGGNGQLRPAWTTTGVSITAVTASNITQTGVTITVSRSNPAAGTLRLAIYPAGSATPTYTIGSGWSGSPVYTDSDVDPGTGSTYQFVPDASGLTPSTDYVAYVVWDDGATTVGPVSTTLTTTSAGVTVSLTGQASATAQGTLSTSIGGNVTVSLSGQSVAVDQGAVGSTRLLAVTSQTITVSTGTLSNSTDTPVTVSLSGQSITPTQGGLAYSSSRILSGSALTFQYGRVGLEGVRIEGLNRSVFVTVQQQSPFLLVQDQRPFLTVQ